MKHIIVYGPKGCGKTFNREAIGKHFNADVVIDDWGGNVLLNPRVKCPFTDGRFVRINYDDVPVGTVVYLLTSTDYKHPLKSQLPDRPQGDRLAIYNYANVAFVQKESDDPLTELGLSEPRDDASIFQSSRTEVDRPSDEYLMRTIIDAYDELRGRGYEVSVLSHPDLVPPANTRTTHVTLVKKMKGDAKCNDQQQ